MGRYRDIGTAFALLFVVLAMPAGAAELVGEARVIDGDTVEVAGRPPWR